MLATTSCGWVKLKADAYKDSKEYSETEFRKAESIYYKSSSTTPEFCVALSGGGIRSAAYSIGVLKGLHVIERQVPDRLPDIDIISAVSGGSYAATWFYDQYAQKASSDARGLNRMDKLNEVLSETSIRKVAGNVEYFNSLQALVTVGGVLNTHGKTVAAGMTGDWQAVIINYLAGLFKPNLPPWKEKHMTPSGAAYESFITNGFQFSGPRRSISPASKDLPYLIVNGTIQASPTPGSSEDAKTPEHLRLANTIFEFTSHGMGSPSVGYKSWAELKPEDRASTYTFARLASISGAVVDTSTSNAVLFLGSEAGLGYALLTPTYSDAWIRRFIRLTDGGDSENLGAYGLIKRNCKEILVVDAEYDGKIDAINQNFYGKPIDGYEDGYQFKSYQLLKDKLCKEGRELTIDKLDQATNSLNCEGKSKIEAVEPPENWHCWNEKQVNTKRKWFNCSEPTNEGFVDGQNGLKVTHVKLSADRKFLDDFASNGKDKAKAQEVYGPFITDLYKKQKEGKEGKKLDKDFPHYSTFRFIWAPEDFLAVAELGCRAVVRHYTPDLLSPSAKACIFID
ncbi:MAG: patatin-like phospholipase family protein [Nitrospira sp.]|jgi:hypothetical protein|nr:patatin-like phospholipase family protein [Nitrospira sp.]